MKFIVHVSKAVNLYIGEESVFCIRWVITMHSSVGLRIILLIFYSIFSTLANSLR